MGAHVCVVIPACNEAARIGALLAPLRGWKRRPEVIVVANGCTDATAKRARQLGARLVEFAEPLGHDVGRAVGLAASDADIFVVLDADVPCRPPELEPFVQAVERGVDLALNQYPLRHVIAFRHPTSIAKRAVNLFLERPDLQAASLTAVPHAISRRAVGQLGPAAFAVPPAALARAVLMGLRVEAVAHIPVGARNPLRAPKHQWAMRRLILGDCLEAVQLITEARGSRGGFTDLGRKRDWLQEQAAASGSAHPAEPPPARVRAAAIVPVMNEADSISLVVSRLRARVPEVCVVSNGSADDTPAVARRTGARVEQYPDPLGHDVGRAVGCLCVPATRYLFADGDFALGPRELRPFLYPGASVDIALNRLDGVVPPARQRDAVSVVKRFLNLALDRADLGSASLTSVPHAIHRRVVDAIGIESLAVPPLAQAKAVLAGFRVQAVYAVDVVKRNRRRVGLHSRRHGRPLEHLIIGDHLEAVAHLLATRGPRGGFADGMRRRDILATWLNRDTPFPAPVVDSPRCPP